MCGREDSDVTLKELLVYIRSLTFASACYLGSITSQNGASCGQATPNGNIMVIKHLDASDLPQHQAYTAFTENSACQPVRILAQELRFEE
jgi:hypothetical protein